MNTETEQKKRAVEDAIQDYLRSELSDEGGTLIVTDWTIAYNARQMRDGSDFSAIGSFSSNHSSVAVLLGLATGLYERMKVKLLS